MDEEDTLSLLGFWKRKPLAALQAAAERKMLEARDACRRVFGRNLNVLLNDRDGLSDLILAPGYDDRGFNDLFLRGVLAAFMDGRPALPTEPNDRALLHMAAYLVEQEEILLADGNARAKVAEQHYNDNQPIFDAFFKAGRLAYKGIATTS
jgi:hypothetical protein